MLDQAEWKCVAINDFGHSVTSCFLKLIIPRHYKKPRFLENLQAILSEEGAVNLECKVIGVPQPVLKWYKDGEELKPGDIHRIISGQDGTCCLGTYTCEAQNCMGIAASSASLLGFDDSMKAKKKKTEEQALQRNLSLSTIHEERTSQMYDTPIGDITEDKGEISFSFDGKEVSVSLYETPDLTEEEALQIVEMYADQLSENVTEHNVVELPPLRFVKETSTSGNLLMEAIIIDVSPEYFLSHEEDLRTEADVDDISIAEENGPPNLSLDQDADIVGEDYLEKTMALLSEEKAYKYTRKKSDSQKSVDDYFSLSREHSLSEEKKDDDTHVMSESDLQSFASAKSLDKPKSKSPKLPGDDGQESSEPTKTILFKEDVTKASNDSKNKKERHRSRSRRSSSESEKCQNKIQEEIVDDQVDDIKEVQPKAEEVNVVPVTFAHAKNLIREPTDTREEKNTTEMVKVDESVIIIDVEAKESLITSEEFQNIMTRISDSLSQISNDIQSIEKDIILKSERMSSAATASKSLEIINSLIAPLSEIHSITDAAKESAEAKKVISSLLNSLPQPLKVLQQSLTIVEKCIDVESDNKTLVKKTCVAFIEKCGENIKKLVSDVNSVINKKYLSLDSKVIKEIEMLSNEIDTVIKFSLDTIKTKHLLNEANTIKEATVEDRHLKETQKVLFEFKNAIKALLCIIQRVDTCKLEITNKLKISDIILNNMSVAIHDLQTALEHIENLSIKESNSALPNYNTEIIKSVMDPVVKLRSSFEQLSREGKCDDKEMLNETLGVIEMNLSRVALHISKIENEIGTFDVLQSENKLDILQKIAQILICLENNLSRLEIIPEIKTHMSMFHKNLTKVLENVIENNEANKYNNLIEICDAVNRINSFIQDIESDNILPLASISNTLRIIQDKFSNNIFESELNCLLLTNITDILIGIQETVNKAEEDSLCFNSDYVDEMPCIIYDAPNPKTVIQQIDQTIASINIVKSLEAASFFQESFLPILENVNPLLEELKHTIASVIIGAGQDENASEILPDFIAKKIAYPLCELNQNILVLSQIIIENTDSIRNDTESIATFAEPLHELHKTLEIFQQDILSQYSENLTPYEISVNVASAVNNLQSCILMVQEQTGVEGAEEMSTLEDISGIKTSADTIFSDRLLVPTGEVIVPELNVIEFEARKPQSSTIEALQILNEHLTVLQTPEIMDVLETLSEVSELSSFKSVVVGLGKLHTAIEEVMHPVLFNKSDDILNTIDTSKLLSIAEPMQDLQQHLLVLEINNIPIYENVLQISPEKIQKIIENISIFQEKLYRCMQSVFPALETAENTIQISKKIGTLKEVCQELKYIIETTGIIESNDQGCIEMRALQKSVENLLEATDVSKGIVIEQVKSRIEELYDKIVNVQDELIQFTPKSHDKFAQEVQLIEVIHEVEKNVAILEQYDFIDLSKASDLTSCASPQVAMEVESLSFVEIDDIAENAVHVVQDSIQETPLADFLIMKEFFKTCKNSFALLRCLTSKTLSYKKTIRVLQEFYMLQSTIDEFKLRKLDLNLSDDINDCLTKFLVHADECLKIVQSSLIKVIEGQANLLFQAPLSTIESTLDTLDEMVVEDAEMKEVLLQFKEILNVAKPCVLSAKVDIIEELKEPYFARSNSKGKFLSEKIEAFVRLLENKIETSNKNTKLKLKNVLKIIQKHAGYKDATGTGQIMILLKCLTECTNVIQEKSTYIGSCGVITEQVATSDKDEIALQSAVTGMLEPLEALHNQIKYIQEQVLTGVDEESISLDVTTTKSLKDTMTQIHKDIVEKMDAVPVDGEDVSFLSEDDMEIQSIQNSLKTIDNVKDIKSLDEMLTPLEGVEKTMQNVFTPQHDVVDSKGGFTRGKQYFILLTSYISLTYKIMYITRKFF